MKAAMLVTVGSLQVTNTPRKFLSALPLLLDKSESLQEPKVLSVQEGHEHCEKSKEHEKK
jgi:hypothetical protein